MSETNEKRSLEKNVSIVKSEEPSTPPNSPQVIIINEMKNEMRPVLTPRRKKGVEDYALEYKNDLVARCIPRDGKEVQILVCRFCPQSVAARIDRIKDHLMTKEHLHLKSSANAVQNEGRDFLMDYSMKSELSEGSELEGNENVKSEPVSPNTSNADVNHVRPKIERPTHSSGSVERNTGEGDGVLHEQIPQPSTNEQYEHNLRIQWHDYKNNTLAMYAKYQEEDHFTDVLLSCQGENFKCHKLVLAACSSYFEDVFLRRSGSENSIFFFTDIHKRELAALVEFMYKGEVTLVEGQLGAFLKAAKKIQIKGLLGSAQQESPTSMAQVKSEF